MLEQSVYHLALVMFGLALLFGAVLPNSNFRAAVLGLLGASAVAFAFMGVPHA